MLPAATGPPACALTHTELERFGEYFYRRTGVRLAPSRRAVTAQRLAHCIAEAGETDFGAWFARVRLHGDDALFEHAAHRLLVHETYFFREDVQLDALTTSVLAEVTAVRRAGGALRVLSLPCSTGEEAYSIAIWLLERWPALADHDVEIAAADVDRHAVAAARRGVYGERALKRVGAEQLERHFVAEGEGRHRVGDALREAIDFRVANLSDPASMAALGVFDVIFCRNLLIYFDELAARRAAEHLYSALRPGGFLFLGHSESMSRISSIFDPVRLPRTHAYRRPLEGDRP